ncbi:MAG: YihY/virulence factor BrkB family protein [Geminicoccaceae bacterium]|nr:MAG: YihY/virulence factor BrkB family protein [Geminicoccaceae bacterium]
MPSGPRKLGLIGRVTAAFNGFNDNHQAIHAGHIAFVALLSLFPFLIVIVASAGLVGTTEAAREVVALALEQVPHDVGAVLGPVAIEVIDAPRRGALTIGLVGALWAASTGFEALRYAFDRAYGVEQPRQMWWARLQSLGLTILFAFVTLMAALSVLVVPRLLQVAASILDRPQWAAPTVPWFANLMVFALLVIMTAALFKTLPFRRLRWGEVMPGAVFTVLGWALAVRAFELYLTHVAIYSLTYGSLGGVVATLMFFYIAAAVLLFGCELNAAGYRAAA